MIKIDGSFGEGGGQILRTSISLSALFQIPCHIFNIRKKRPRPGLMTQHLLGLRALAELTQGRVEGDHLESEEIKFFPGSWLKDKISIKIPTAGSITLILQTLFPVLISIPKTTEIYFKGGATDTFFSPSLDHFRFVFLEILKKIAPAIEANFEIKKRGFYPEGGAELKVKVKGMSPKKFSSLFLTDPGEIEKVIISSGASLSLKERKVAERQAGSAERILKPLKWQIEKRITYWESPSPGSFICILGKFKKTTIGIDKLGEIGKSSEKVGEEAGLDFLREGKKAPCLDRYTADQILPYLALIKEKSKVKVSEITEHCKTNMYVIEKFAKGRFKVKDNLIEWLPGKEI